MSDKVSVIASNITYAASGSTAFFGAWTANELALLAGFLLGVATFAVNLYYKRKQLALDEYYREQHLVLKRKELEIKQDAGV